VVLTYITGASEGNNDLLCAVVEPNKGMCVPDYTMKQTRCVEVVGAMKEEQRNARFLVVDDLVEMEALSHCILADLARPVCDLLVVAVSCARVRHHLHCIVQVELAKGTA
jgi:hypothetical protein